MQFSPIPFRHIFAKPFSEFIYGLFSAFADYITSPFLNISGRYIVEPIGVLFGHNQLETFEHFIGRIYIFLV